MNALLLTLILMASPTAAVPPDLSNPATWGRGDTAAFTPFAMPWIYQDGPDEDTLYTGDWD